MVFRIKSYFLLVVTSIIVVNICCYNGVVSTGSEKSMVGKIVYAVNAGGLGYTDSDGITYQPDPSTNGISSDYGKRFWTIGRVDPEDSILYQTERYSQSTFGYDIEIKDDGDYVLVMKFAEVYFLNPNKKVFDIRLNDMHNIVEQLDIFSEVGHGVAHDEVIPFKISANGRKLKIKGEESTIKNNKIRLEFIKGALDNPKINAFYVIKGTEFDVPKLPIFEPPSSVAQNSDRKYENLIELPDDDEEDEMGFTNYQDGEPVETAQEQKRKRRLIRQPPFKSINDIEEDDWLPVIQVGGSLVFAMVVAFIVKKFI